MARKVFAWKTLVALLMAAMSFRSQTIIPGEALQIRPSQMNINVK
ncbi:putative tDP-4-oxo-6-deoxy-D-glucose transaminase [Synechococcus sp. WH 8103]|nr:putative tDP-4-oxo-6-deoxy-D-glucose transaminase [Synechococcus sp. WH 8103]